MSTPTPVRVEPDAEGFLPNGWVDSYPHNDFEHPCTNQCCMPEAYANPDVWYCQDPGCRKNNDSHHDAKLRQPGECINCCPPLPSPSAN